jgi:hypothetical protein
MMRPHAGAALLLVLSSGMARADLVEVSAPILPLRMIANLNSGTNFPSTPECERALVVAASKTYAALLPEAAAGDNTLTLLPDGGSLTPQQLQANYSGTALYAYNHYDSKPYWIPRLVDDVDVCGLHLGSDWHLPTQDEVESFTQADLTFLRDTVAGADVNGTQFGSFFFSLHMFVRARDGTLQVGNLTPGAVTRVFPISYPAGTGALVELQSPLNVGLRCIRTTSHPGGDVPGLTTDGGYCPGVLGVDGYVPDAGPTQRPDAGSLDFDAGGAFVWTGTPGSTQVMTQPRPCPLMGDPCVARFQSAVAQAQQCFGHVSTCWMGGNTTQCGYSPDPGQYDRCFWWDHSAVTGLVPGNFITVYPVNHASACLDWQEVGGLGQVATRMDMFEFSYSGTPGAQDVTLSCGGMQPVTIPFAQRADCFDPANPRQWVCCDNAFPEMCITYP